MSSHVSRRQEKPPGHAESGLTSRKSDMQPYPVVSVLLPGTHPQTQCFHHRMRPRPGPLGTCDTADKLS